MTAGRQSPRRIRLVPGLIPGLDYLKLPELVHVVGSSWDLPSKQMFRCRPRFPTQGERLAGARLEVYRARSERYKAIRSSPR